MGDVADEVTHELLFKFLKMLIDLGGNEENQDLTAFFKVVGKALHIMALSTPCMDMLV